MLSSITINWYVIILLVSSSIFGGFGGLLRHLRRKNGNKPKDGGFFNQHRALVRNLAFGSAAGFISVLAVMELPMYKCLGLALCAGYFGLQYFEKMAEDVLKQNVITQNKNEQEQYIKDTFGTLSEKETDKAADNLRDLSVKNGRGKKTSAKPKPVATKSSKSTDSTPSSDGTDDTDLNAELSDDE